jgi:hypothetical protein
MSKALGTFFAFVLIVLLYAVITAFPVMWLWNYCLIGAIPGLKTITFYQAFGIKILFSLLFHTTVKQDNK